MRKALTVLALLGLLSSGSLAAPMPRPVRLVTADDLGLLGTFWPAEVTPSPAVILVHGAGGSRTNWQEFAELLQDAGLAVFAFDLRGHGDSTRRLTADGPVFVDQRALGPRDYTLMALDLETAMNWVATQPEILKERIAIVGADLGANLAVRYATLNPDVAALVLLSPTLDSHGIDISQAIGQVHLQHVRFVVAKNDAVAANDTRQLIQTRRRAVPTATLQDLIVCSGQRRGTDLISGVENLDIVLRDWLQTVLREPAPAAAAEAPAFRTGTAPPAAPAKR